tara:strand:+ start:337 stop:519 length:183 start_codon:yes stop_codon:yes gene_type:complete
MEIKMLTLDEIREKLNDVNMSKVSRDTGLSRPTIYKFLNSMAKMEYDTVKKVSDYFEKEA